MSTNSIADFFGGIRRFITNAGGEIGAWLAPLPSAVSVANAAQKHLAYEPWLAGVVGLIVELLGFATTNRAFDLWYYNQTRRDDEPKAPLGIAVGLVVAYVISTIALSVISDLATDIVHYLPAIFPIMALTGTINVALGRQHDIRVQANRAAAEARQAATDKVEAERKQREIEAKAESMRHEQEAKAEAERLRLEKLQRDRDAEDRAERLRLERKADRDARQAARQATRQGATRVATSGEIDRDTFVRLFTTQRYDDVADVAHALGFNGELRAFYESGRRSVSRLSQLVGVNPRTGQRWIDASGVATGDASGDATDVATEEA